MRFILLWQGEFQESDGVLEAKGPYISSRLFVPLTSPSCEEGLGDCLAAQKALKGFLISPYGIIRHFF